MNIFSPQRIVTKISESRSKKSPTNAYSQVPDRALGVVDSWLIVVADPFCGASGYESEGNPPAKIVLSIRNGHGPLAGYFCWRKSPIPRTTP